MSEIHASREDAKARRDIEEVAAIVVDGQLIVELKSVENTHPVHSSQTASDLPAPDEPALLINFASSRLRVHQQEAQS